LRFGVSEIVAKQEHTLRRKVRNVGKPTTHFIPASFKSETRKG
jgi:hypothetical protein